MTNPIARIQSLLENVRLLGPMMGYLPALRYLVATQGQADALTQATYNEIPFSFRRRDISAVREVLLNGEYDFLKPVIQNAEKPLILDIGAHIGLFSIWALSINPKAEIYSIEASPGTYRILSENIRAAQKKGLLWKADNRAAWGSAGEISFMDSAESSMSHRVGSEGNIKIPTITLNEILSRTGNRQTIDLIKIDIEGAEESFLCVPDINLGHFKNLAIEIHPALCNTDRVKTLLQENFKVENVKQDTPGCKPLLYCETAA